MKIKNIPSVVKLLDYFEDHARYNERYRSACIAWNIKLSRAFLGLQEEHYEEYSLDKKWDEKWVEYKESNDDLFWDTCNNCLDWVDEQYLYTHGMEFNDFKLYRVGRSGGHLILNKFDGFDLEGFDLTEEAEQAYYDNMPDEDEDDEESKPDDSEAISAAIDTVICYADLYHFCKAIDDMDPDDHFLSELAHHRSFKEEEWEEEEEDERRERLGLIDLPGQLYLSEELEAMAGA